MTSVPIPFLTALLLFLLAGTNHQQLSQTSTGRVFRLFLYINALDMVFIGFRWSHGILALLPVAAALVVVAIALMYLAFYSLGRSGPVITATRDWQHLIPLMLILAAIPIQSGWVEFLLIATKLLYAGLLIKLAIQGAASLQLVRLNWLSNSRNALWGAAALLIISSAVDMAIVVDFALYEGRHSAKVVSVANLLVVGLLGWASVFAGRAKGIDLERGKDHELQAPDNPTSPTNKENNDNEDNKNTNVDNGDPVLYAKLNQLLNDEHLYADTELNLQKLARKAGVPARIVSRTINTHAGKNVSQWVNQARIEAASNLLLNKETSVTEVMLEAGFLTKSNFNREFRRLKGCSPSDWRSKN